MNILKGQHWAVIPSRANSQRFPGKAHALLEGQELWLRMLTTVCKAHIDKVIINTDDEKIMDFEAPCNFDFYQRPKRLCGGDVKIDSVLLDMVNSLDEVPEFLHLVQLTSPFIHYSHIEEGINLLKNHIEADSVQLVTSVSNIFHAYSQRAIVKGFIDFRFPRDRKIYYNSQRKNIHYVFCGYVGFRTESLLKYGNIWGKKSLPIIGGPECAIDIDTPEDLKFAECYLQMKREEVKYASNI